MKKLFLGAAIAMGSLAFAQQFGAKAGINVATLTKTEGIDQEKAKVGFHGGLFANFPIAESFSIQPELLYSQYGNKVVDEYTTNLAGVSTTYKETYTTSLDYVTLPVMLQYNATPSFYLEAGPEFGLLVGAKDKGDAVMTVNGTTTSSSYNEDIKEHVNGFNVGIGLGAGYYFTPNIGVSARYVAGFSDVAKENSGDAVKNNVFQAGVNFKF